MQRLSNVGLRGFTLFGKFLLVFFLAKFLEPESVGLYGLLSGTIGYVLYLLGFEFYTYTTREIVHREQNEWGYILKGQLYFTGALYVLLLPFTSLIYVFNILPMSTFYWFFALLVLEHLAQEFNRIFVAMSKPLLASIVLFLRSALWVFFIIAIMFHNHQTRNLDTILTSWVLGAFSACALSAFYIYRLKDLVWTRAVDWQWIFKGICIALPFLLSSASIRAIYILDRYWIESLVDIKTVAVYVLFIGIANAMISFLDSGVFVFFYPQLILAHKQQLSEKFRSGILKLSAQVTGTILLFSITALILIEPLLTLIGRSEYIEKKWMFPFILLAMSFFSLGMIPQYGLYAQSKDRQIVISNLISFFVFIISTYLISFYSKEWAVIAGLNISLFVGAAWCTYMYITESPRNYIFKKPDV